MLHLHQTSLYQQRHRRMSRADAFVLSLCDPLLKSAQIAASFIHRKLVHLVAALMKRNITLVPSAKGDGRRIMGGIFRQLQKQVVGSKEEMEVKEEVKDVLAEFSSNY